MGQFDNAEQLVADTGKFATEEQGELLEAALTPNPTVDVIGSDQAGGERGGEDRGADGSGSIPKAVDGERAEVGQADAEGGDAERFDQLDGPDARRKLRSCDSSVAGTCNW